MNKLSVVIITYNEEKKVGECLQSLNFIDEIIVVDSQSQDRTVEIAEKAGVKIYSRKLDDFSSQKNFGIEQANGNWVLLIDADERLTEELKKEIVETIQMPNINVGYYIKRNNFMFGSRLRFGASLNDFQLRLIKKGQGRFQGLVHERICPAGPVGTLKNPLVHKTYQTLEEYFAKFNLFSSLDAKELLKQGQKITWVDIVLKPVVNFFYFYFLKLGFIDGKAGFVYQTLSSFYVFVRNVKVLEYKKDQFR